MPSITAAQLLAWLPSQLPETFVWLERMVDINSFSTNPHGVNKVGALTAECFVELGFSAESVPSTDPTYGSHLFLRRKGNGSSPPVVFVTHLDTVFPPEEEERNNFRWQPAPEENRIYGPGTVDIKGGTVLIWLMLRALREFAPDVFEKTHWLIAANASEEVMSGDFAMRTKERCAGARAVLVFEGGPRDKDEWHIVTSRKGRAEYRITAEGRAAHAGSAHAQGVNAVVGLCDAVQRAAALTDYAANLTVNVASISGGTVLNRVPHEAEAALEMRAFDPVVLQRTGDAVLSLAGQAGNGARICAQCLGVTPAWPSDAATQGLSAHWAEAARELGLKLKTVPRGGLSDANYLCQLGPTLDGLGPSGANAHCSERSADGSKLPEYVEPDSFVPKTALNVLALLRLLS